MNLGKYLFRLFMWNVVSKSYVAIGVKPKYHQFKTRESDPFPKPPFMLVSNHGTFQDPWIVGAMSPYPLGIMTNDDGFRGKGFIQWYLKSIGAYPKKKGASDFKAMKTTMELLKDKYPVCIFPEGQTTWDGETQLLNRGIEKIVKKMNIPLVIVHIKGNFLTKPWWAFTERKGSIAVDFKVVDSETVSKLSADEIFDKIRTSIYQNDVKDTRNREVPFTGKMLAKGLERFVWICMDCGSEDTLVTEGNTISCTACRKQWTIDAHCQLTAQTTSTKSLADLKDWSDMHRSRILEIVDSGKEFTTQTSAVSLSCENELLLFDPVYGDGILSMTRDELKYKSQSGECRVWPVNEIEDYVVQKKDIFEFRLKDKIWRVEFRGGSPMKWVMYFRYLNGFKAFEDQGHL